MPYKDEQIVIIAPGSKTTLAQLGIQESIGPASLRLRSCMFPAEKEGEWEPYKVRPWPKSSKDADVDHTEQAEKQNPEFFEDYSTDEGAVWPLEGGKIVNWSCFFALLSYVHRRLSPHLHSPMLLVAQPGWTARDYEKLTQFYFERFKPPCFVIVDAALNALWAYNVINGCVIDVGFDKADVSAIADFSLQKTGRGVMLEGCGGAAMTAQLLSLLRDQGFDQDMAEQLKRSAICEILPHGTPFPGSEPGIQAAITNPAAAASTGAIGSGPGQRVSSGAMGDVPMGPGPGTQVGEETADGVDSDGVLDVASIVANNKKMEEFLAKKEREKQEKAEKAAKKKGVDTTATSASRGPIKLRNMDKVKATFTYEIPTHLKKPENTVGGANGAVKASNGQATTEAIDVNAETTESSKTQEIEVGLERFQAASDGILEKIADAVHLSISCVEDVSKRSEVWDNLIVVGNGAKIRGFREALLSVIYKKYIISPSSATMFTSELPSHTTTPTGTGANTPQPQQPLPQGFPQSSSSVNPLLVAAVTSQSAQYSQSQGQLPSAHSTNYHSSHGQTPTSIKYAKMGEYFPEWKDTGFDEAHFLGAQVMAKVLFVVDGGATKGYMTRNDYNEMGPSGIHEFGP